MIYYLLDTSAVVLEYDPKALWREKNCMKRMMEQGKKKEAFLFLPDFCVVEAFNTLAKWRWRDNKFSKEQYDTAKKALERDVKRIDRIDGLDDQRRFYAYDLHRYHILNCNKVFEVEHTTALSGALSTFDILIIAMGMELVKIHTGQSVHIVTRDQRLKEIARKLQARSSGEFAQVIYLPEDPELPSVPPYFLSGKAKNFRPI